MIIETIEKNLRKRGNVRLVAKFTEETSFQGGNFDPRNVITRKLTELRLEGPTGTVSMDPAHFDLHRLNAHATSYFNVNGKTFKPMAELPKVETQRTVLA